ncbi:MAG: Ig-like domain-containing protein [Nocardioides sp.]|nr:Ig-like domain-containing protein [Nocardioides sp.]
MTITHLRTRVRLAAAVGLSTSMAAVGMVAAVPAAHAASTSIAYACTADGLGGFTLPVVLDTNAPARMVLGESAQVTLTASAVLPAALAKQAVMAGATEFDGSWVAKASFGAAAADVTQTITPRAQLGPQTVETAVPFTAASAPFTYVAPATPGAVEVTAGDLAGSLQFYPSGGGAITCTLPNGKAPLIDTIAVVAASTTTLALDRTTSAFGQDVTATAKVATSAGAPDGDVSFSVDGVATTVRVGKDGVATVLLPDPGAGAHSVTATFVPRNASAYDGSTSAATAWTVAKAATKMRVPVTRKTTTTVTRVGVRTRGAFDTVPTGKVRIKLTRIGTAGKWVKVRTLSSDGSARAGFGTLKKGRYQVVVTYRGDANHTSKKKVKRFRVTRG